MSGDDSPSMGESPTIVMNRPEVKAPDTNLYANVIHVKGEKGVWLRFVLVTHSWIGPAFDVIL